MKNRNQRLMKQQRQKQRLELSQADFPKRFKICKKTKVSRGPKVSRTKCISFGDRRYGNYTTHKDTKRKQNYIRRHKKRENWGDMASAGFWAKNLLWNKPTLSASIRDVEKRKGVIIARRS